MRSPLLQYMPPFLVLPPSSSRSALAGVTAPPYFLFSVSSFRTSLNDTMLSRNGSASRLPGGEAAE
ncbi:hypothetical protein ACFS7Z_22815 [Pontibacter toksunensis]|uniref:Secreted protein n=1 Tax=Pontibacter toksunensis TaxID=1332631 RepID=A0ABW6C1D2_9BACT